MKQIQSFRLIIGSFRNWFELSAYCAIPPVCLVLGALWLPETPRYLLEKNKMEKAVASYKWLNRIKDNSLAQEEVMQVLSPITFPELGLLIFVSS